MTDREVSVMIPEGWRLGSLCELGEDDWYVCLIDDESFAHTGTGKTPTEASMQAFVTPPKGRLFNPAMATEPKKSLMDLLHKPVVLNDRRI